MLAGYAALHRSFLYVLASSSCKKGWLLRKVLVAKDLGRIGSWDCLVKACHSEKGEEGCMRASVCVCERKRKRRKKKERENVHAHM